MKFIRFLLTCLILVLALALVLCAAAFVPLIQTWALQSALDRQESVHGTVESVWGAFGKVEISDVHLKNGTAVLTIPSIEASLPLIPALIDHKVAVRSLLAKGWTLDLTQSPELVKSLDLAPPPAADPKAVPQTNEPPKPAEQARQIIRSFFHGWSLPFDVSLDGLDIEGDILVRSPGNNGASHIHVVLSGGGLSAGHTGEFAVDVSAPVTDSRVPYVSASAHGQLGVVMPTPRTISRLEFKGDLSALGGPFPALSADAAIDRSSGLEECTLELIRGGESLASFLTHYSRDTHRLTGTWKLNLKDTDISPFTLDHPLPALSSVGDGKFDSDIAFDNVHASGQLKTEFSHLGAVFAPLEQVGSVSTDTKFDATQNGQSLSIEQLSSSVKGSHLVLDVKLLQAFGLDEKSGVFSASKSEGDWMQVSVVSLPLKSLSGFTGSLGIAGNDATGKFIVHPTKDGFSVRPIAPLIASDVSISRNTSVLADRLELALSLNVDYGSAGWQIEAAPLAVSRDGKRMATLNVKTTRTGDTDQPFVCAINWDSDLAAVAALPLFKDLPKFGAQTASGDLTLTLGSAMQIEGKFAVAGHDTHHSFSSNVTGGIDADGRFEFLAPMKIDFGSHVSELTAEGLFGRDDSGPRFELKLTGPHVFLDQLRLIGDPLATTLGVPIPTGFASTGSHVAVGAKDLAPFWGNWSGVVRVGFDRLEVGAEEIKNVGGTLEFDQSGLQLKNGRAAFDLHSVASLEGSLLYSADAALPYTLKVSSSIDQIEASTLFGTTQWGDDPILEGRFAVARLFTGEGINLSDLYGRVHEEFKMTSKVGIVRVLKTNVGDAIPQVNTPVADSVGKVGSFVGTFLGAKKDSLVSGKNPVSKSADAVLEFINQISEIGYDQASVTAIQDPDGNIRLTEISMTAPDETLQGTGLITYVKGQPLGDRPLSVELKLAVRHKPAELTTVAGLPTFGKDGQGFTILSQPVQLGGTLLHVDSSKWHDVLAKAAAAKPVDKKKSD